MHLKYYGDSYDIVKQSLLRWLSPFGRWMVHPMFTEAVTPDRALEFAKFLGVELLTSQVIDSSTDRETYFRGARLCPANLFLDPDTGLRPESIGGAKAPQYLFIQELMSITAARPTTLTLVFDQSLPRGNERPALEQKLALMKARGLHGTAYTSHACFVMVSRDPSLIERAKQAVLDQSRLPLDRFL